MIISFCPSGFILKKKYDLDKLLTNIENKQDKITTEIKNKNYKSRNLYLIIIDLINTLKKRNDIFKTNSDIKRINKIETDINTIKDSLQHLNECDPNYESNKVTCEGLFFKIDNPNNFLYDNNKVYYLDNYNKDLTTFDMVELIPVNTKDAKDANNNTTSAANNTTSAANNTTSAPKMDSYIMGNTDSKEWKCIQNETTGTIDHLLSNSGHKYTLIPNSNGQCEKSFKARSNNSIWKSSGSKGEPVIHHTLYTTFSSEIDKKCLTKDSMYYNSVTDAKYDSFNSQNALTTYSLLHNLNKFSSM